MWKNSQSRENSLKFNLHINNGHSCRETEQTILIASNQIWKFTTETTSGKYSIEYTLEQTFFSGLKLTWKMKPDYSLINSDKLFPDNTLIKWDKIWTNVWSSFIYMNVCIYKLDM